jgi:hypothetical protein
LKHVGQERGHTTDDLTSQLYEYGIGFLLGVERVLALADRLRIADKTALDKLKRDARALPPPYPASTELGS